MEPRYQTRINMIKYLDQQLKPLEFKRELQENRGTSFLLFYPGGTDYGQTAESLFRELESYFRTFLHFYFIRTDLCPQLMREFNVHVLPTVITVRNGTVISQLENLRGREELFGQIRLALPRKNYQASANILL